MHIRNSRQSRLTAFVAALCLSFSVLVSGIPLPEAKAEVPEEDFSAGSYEYPGEFAQVVTTDGVEEIYPITISPDGKERTAYIVNFRHGYVIAETDEVSVIQVTPGSIYYATGNKHMDAEGNESFTSDSEMMTVSRDYGLRYLTGYGDTLVREYQEFLGALSRGTYDADKAPLLSGTPFNLGIIQNLTSPHLNEMSGLFYRYGDSDTVAGMSLGDNSSTPAVGVRQCFVSVSGNDEDGWEFILLKDDFYTAYAKAAAGGARLGRVVSFEQNLEVDGTERVVQLFQYGFLYRDDNGQVQVDAERYYNEETGTFEPVPVQSYISVPAEFGAEVGSIVEVDGTYYQNYEKGVSVGTENKNGGYTFVNHANYRYDGESGELVRFSEAEMTADIDSLTISAAVKSSLGIATTFQEKQLLNKLKEVYLDLFEKDYNPGIVTGTFEVLSGSCEGINEPNYTHISNEAVVLRTIVSDSTYSKSSLQPNMTYFMVSKNSLGEFQVYVVKDLFLERYVPVMGAALSDIGTFTINGTVYEQAQIYEHAFVIVNEAGQAEAHLQYNYDFETQKATVEKLTREQLAYVLDEPVYGVVRWTDETVDSINALYGTQVTEEQILDAMYEAYEKYVDQGLNPGLPYGEGVMLFGNVIKIGFTGSDMPSTNGTSTKEVAYLMYNPVLDEAFFSGGLVMTLGNSGFATSTVDTIQQVGAPLGDMVFMEDGTVYQNFTTGAAVCMKGKLSFAFFLPGQEFNGELKKDEEKNQQAAEQAQEREEVFERNPDYVAWKNWAAQGAALALAGIVGAAVFVAARKYF